MKSDSHIRKSDSVAVESTPIHRPGMRGYLAVSLLLAGAGLLFLKFDLWLTALVVPERIHLIPGDVFRLVKLTEIFAHGYGVALIAIGIYCLAPDSRRFVPRIVACAVWPGICVNLIKVLFARIRPRGYFDETFHAHFPDNISATWKGWMPTGEFNTLSTLQSFPSAHTATAWGLAIGMIWVFPKGRYLFIAVASLASLERVMSSAHWSSDVIFGASLAFLASGAMTQNWGLGYLFGKFESRKIEPANKIDSERLLAIENLAGRPSEQQAA